MKKNLVFLKFDENLLSEEINKDTPLIVVRNFFKKRHVGNIIKLCLKILQ